LAATVSACADQQFGTNFCKVCQVHILGNGLNVVLRAGYLSVRTTGGATNRHWLKVCHINGLTYLLVRVRVK